MIFNPEIIAMILVQFALLTFINVAQDFWDRTVALRTWFRRTAQLKNLKLFIKIWKIFPGFCQIDFFVEKSISECLFPVDYFNNTGGTILYIKDERVKDHKFWLKMLNYKCGKFLGLVE